MPRSLKLNTHQIQGLMKAADILLPGDGISPSLRSLGNAEQVDRILDYMGNEDLEGVRLLLDIFSALPRFMIRLILWISTYDQFVPNVLGVAFRQIQIGIKGLIYTLYYSDLTDDRRIHGEIGWDANVSIQKKGETIMDTERVLEAEISKNKIFESDTDSVFKIARSAEKQITNTPIKERIRKISALRKTVLLERETILSQIQKEVGKSRSDALMSEIFGVLDFLEYLEVNAERVFKNEKVKTPIALMGKKSEIHYDPLGTILVISPWNYPFYQAIVPIANSYVAGNATIYKPSEHTPLRGLIEKLFSDFEPGAVQVVYGDGKTGSDLISKRPDKIFFTGSVATGKKIMSQASELLIPVVLELGGKDPMIVFEDANIHRATRGALWGALTNCGQACTSVEKILVHKNIYGNFKEEITKLAKEIKQKKDDDGDSDIGEMCIAQQVKIVKEHIEDAKNKGAVILTGAEWDGTSSKIPPIVIDRLSSDMKIFKDETFGPIIALIPFETEKEALEMANNSDYGLSASVWSADIQRAKRVSAGIKTGNVSINNVMITEGNPNLPFGGVKMSGFGRLKGEQGLKEFTYSKSIIIDGNSEKTEANWFPYTAEKYKVFSEMTLNLFTHGPISFFKFLLTGLKLESLSNKLGKKGRNS